MDAAQFVGQANQFADISRAIIREEILDELLSDFLEKMMGSLKDSVISETKEVEAYLGDSLEKLTKKPESLEEMQQTKNVYLEIKMQQGRM